MILLFVLYFLPFKNLYVFYIFSKLLYKYLVYYAEFYSLNSSLNNFYNHVVLQLIILF